MKGKLIKISSESYKLVSLDGDFVIKGKLSLKNCQVIERGYDLMKLAEENSNKYYDIKTTDWHCNYNGFFSGFQKALELIVDKKFSDEDIKKVVEISRKGSLQENHNGYGVSTESIFVLDNLSVNEIIQSLQQTEWDVEVCTLNDCYGDYNLCYSRHFDCEICTDTGIPKLDENGCLILKRI
jgi:hypothetical protein